jgi:hypothetical protein
VRLSRLYVRPDQLEEARAALRVVHQGELPA